MLLWQVSDVKNKTHASQGQEYCWYSWKYWKKTQVFPFLDVFFGIGLFINFITMYFGYRFVIEFSECETSKCATKASKPLIFYWNSSQTVSFFEGHRDLVIWHLVTSFFGVMWKRRPMPKTQLRFKNSNNNLIMENFIKDVVAGVIWLILFFIINLILSFS